MSPISLILPIVLGLLLSIELQSLVAWLFVHSPNTQIGALKLLVLALSIG